MQDHVLLVFLLTWYNSSICIFLNACHFTFLICDVNVSQKVVTEQVKEELKELEAKVAEKQKGVEKLTEEIREANLRSLSLIPAEEGKFINEGNL